MDREKAHRLFRRAVDQTVTLWQTLSDLEYEVMSTGEISVSMRSDVESAAEKFDGFEISTEMINSLISDWQEDEEMAEFAVADLDPEEETDERPRFFFDDAY